jgi:hypothetical protein
VIIGNPSVFAIESGVTQAYERLSQRALGFFVIHVGGRRFGVYEPDATMMGCSFDTVERRIAERGTHTASFANESDGGMIADAFRSAVYAEEQDERYLGIPLAEFRDLFYPVSSDLLWAPDGDEAFDDGSFVLQFDVEERVRLIAFRSGEGYVHNPATLSDVWLPADEFYRVLQQWHQAFYIEWAAMPKAPNTPT